MCTLDNFNIDINSLGHGDTHAEYQLGADYFKAVDGGDVKDGDVKASITMRRTATGCEIDMHVEGTVIVSCDRCLDDMRQPISGDGTLTVKLQAGYTGKEPLYDGETMIMNADDTRLNIAWPIYETIALAVPARHVHDAGQCNPGMKEALGKYIDGNDGSHNSPTAADPRWDALRKLKPSEGQ